MGGIFGGSQAQTPPPPPPLPPAAIPPTLANPTVAQAGASELAKASKGFGATNKTGGQGDLTKPSTANPGLTSGSFTTG
jgi:hypothetical protein